MKTHDRELFKDQLIKKKTALLQAIKRAMDSSRQTDARLTFELVQDNPDRSVDELLKHVDSHVLGSKAEELAVIETALLKIRHGSYGECEQCGEYISLERLKVYPEARCCVECQNRLERMNTPDRDQIQRPSPPGTDNYLDDSE